MEDDRIEVNFARGLASHEDFDRLAAEMLDRLCGGLHDATGLLGLLLRDVYNAGRARGAYEESGGPR